MSGTWTLSVFDTDATPAADVNVFNFWRLDATAAVNTRKPV